MQMNFCHYFRNFTSIQLIFNVVGRNQTVGGDPHVRYPYQYTKEVLKPSSSQCYLSFFLYSMLKKMTKKSFEDYIQTTCITSDDLYFKKL